MFDVFDDELDQMFEGNQNEDKKKLNIALSLNDPIKVLPKSKFVSLQENTPLNEVVDKLQQYSTGCVLLENDDKISGIFTERDAMTKVLGRKLDLEKEVISDYMTKNPECLHFDDPISYALNKMVSGGYRHVPLVDADKNPLGVVSMQNIINQLGDYFFDEIVNLPPVPLREQSNREGG